MTNMISRISPTTFSGAWAPTRVAALAALTLLASSSAMAQDITKAEGVPESAVAAAEEAAKAAAVDPKTNAELSAEDLTKATEEATALRTTADAALKAAETAEAEKARINRVIERRGFWWNKRLSAGLTGSMLFSDSFVGQVDGWTANAGFLIDGGINLGWNGIELRNTGKLQEAFISTPAIGSWDFDNFNPVFLKAADVAEWESLLLYTFPGFPYIGPYARAKAGTQVFTGQQYFAEDTTVRYRKPGSAVDPTTCAPTTLDAEGGPEGCLAYAGGGNAEPVGLTGFFEPIILEEAVGAIILPPSFPPWVEYKLQAGIGARQIVARDAFFGALGNSGYVLNDDADTPEVDLVQLTSVASIGPEAEAQVNGAIYDRVTWNVKASVYYAGAAFGLADGLFIPAIDEGNPIKDISAGPLAFESQLLGPMTVSLESLVTLKLLDWLSINWQNRIRREPFVTTAVQMQSQVLLTVGYTIF